MSVTSLYLVMFALNIEVRILAIYMPSQACLTIIHQPNFSLALVEIVKLMCM